MQLNKLDVYQVLNVFKFQVLCVIQVLNEILKCRLILELKCKSTVKPCLVSLKYQSE